MAIDSALQLTSFGMLGDVHGVPSVGTVPLRSGEASRWKLGELLEEESHGSHHGSSALVI